MRYQNLLCNFGIKEFSRLILPVKIKLRLHKGYIKSETVFYIDKIDKKLTVVRKVNMKGLNIK